MVHAQPLIAAEIVERERRYMREAAQLEERAQAAYATDPAAAEALLTDYVVRTGQQLTRGWRCSGSGWWAATAMASS